MNRDGQGLSIIDSTKLPVRIALIAVLAAVILLTYLAVSWQLANMLAGFTKPTDDNAEFVAESAAGMSSRDPLVAWLKATVKQDKDASEVSLFEEVVRLSPRDYRWWGQMGRAFEQADMPKKAEAAFSYATEIAPNYVLPKWQSGNFYLRQGEDEKALAVFKQAVPLDPVYRDQIFGVVWDYYDEDPKTLESIAGNDPGTIAGLAKFYAAKRLPDESLAAWNRLGDSDREKNKDVAGLIAQALYDRGYFRTSVKFVSNLGIEKGAGVGKVVNGSFEDEILRSENVMFSWKIVRNEGIFIRVNRSEARSGNRSLEVSFSGFEQPEINNIYQTIAVESGKRYKLRFWVKTERLTSSGRPLVQVINAADSKYLGASEPFSGGTNEWTEYAVEFDVPTDSEGIAVRTTREYCGELCAITGKFYFDDFELDELS